MINLNTSIYSFTHRVAFQSLVDTTKQDILCVSETNFDKTFQNPSYLPTDYNEIIKKRILCVICQQENTYMQRTNPHLNARS